MKKHVLLPFICLLLTSFPRTLHPDIIILKDGRRLEGEITEENGKIQIRMKLGTLTVSKEDVQEIIRNEERETDKDDRKSGGVEIVRLIMQDGIVFEGNLIHEDHEKIKVKMDQVTTTFVKEDIARIERRFISTEEAAAIEKQKNTYRSFLLGYKITRPDPAWSFKLDPPEPLVDILIMDYSTQSEIAVMAIPIETGEDIPFTEEALHSHLSSIEVKLSEKFFDVKRDSSKVTKFKEWNAFEMVHTGRRKDTNDLWRLEQRVFRVANTLYFLFFNALDERYEKTKEAFDAVAESFELFEAKETEGNRFTSFDTLFTVEKSEDWEFRKSEPECNTVLLNIVNADGTGVFAVRAGPSEDADLRTYAMKYKKKLANADNFTISRSEFANLKGMVCYRIVESHSTNGKQMNFEHVIFIDAGRAYVVSQGISSDNPQTVQSDLKRTFDSFQILRDRLGKSTIENGIKAIKIYNEADRQYYAGHFEEAIAFYREAIKIFPRFAAAYNNMALCLQAIGKLNDSIAAYEKSYHLFNEHPLIRVNYAMALINRASLNAEKGNTADAKKDLKRAELVAGEDEHVTKNLAIGWVNVGIAHHNRKAFEAALDYSKKALRYDPDNADIKRAIANTLATLAAKALSKQDVARARRLIKEALTYDPDNPDAQQVKKRLEKRQ